MVLAVRGFQDTQCGFEAYQKDAARRLFSRQRLERFSFDLELLFLEKKTGRKVAVLPIRWYYADYSTMGLLEDDFLMFVDILKVRLNEFRGLYR